MNNLKREVEAKGFYVEEFVYSEKEVNSLITLIERNKKTKNDNFRQSKDLYAIRNLLQEVPELLDKLLNPSLSKLLQGYFNNSYFAVKGIYFDKPPLSTWFVNWHQDLTISVNKKIETEGFINWTLKAGQQAVQPSVEYLENILTARIHLDDTDEKNGGLHVIPGSHSKGVIDEPQIRLIRETQSSEICKVKKGGIMFMKPLTLHASYKSINDAHRRVIHIEFTSKELSNGLDWRERINCR